MTITTLARRIGHSLTGQQSRTDALTAEDANRQYHAEAANWLLPPGWQWPDEPYPDTAPDGAGVRYGPGIGRQDAQRRWQLAWYHALLEPASETEREAAFAQLANHRQTSIRPEVQAARAGDFTKLRRFLEANLPGYRR